MRNLLRLHVLLAAIFPVAAIVIAAAPLQTPTCDLEVRFVDNTLEWRCDEERDCDTCGVNGECASHRIAPLPGSGQPTRKSCRCEDGTNVTHDTCHTEIDINEGQVSVECIDNSDPCNCQRDFYIGSPHPKCDETSTSDAWAQLCNRLRGKEDSDNPN